MIHLKPPHSQQVRLAAAFLAVKVPEAKMLAGQQARTVVCSLRAAKLTGQKAADLQNTVRVTEVCSKKNSLYTFEAGICMKTNEHKTQCPKIIGHFMSKFRIFLFNRCHLAEKCRIERRFVTSIRFFAGSRK
jgi:hypothetical protein